MRNALLALALTAGPFAAGHAAAQQTPPPPPGPDSPPRMRGPGMGGMGGGMGALMMADTNHDGIVTREEAVAAADKRFDALDTNRDGIVSGDEMAAGMPPRRAQGQGQGGEPPAMPSMTRQQFHDRALRQFDRLDANHDGKVDAAEMAAYRDMVRERRQERRGGDMAPPPPAPPPPAGNQ